MIKNRYIEQMGLLLKLAEYSQQMARQAIAVIMRDMHDDGHYINADIHTEAVIDFSRGQEGESRASKASMHLRMGIRIDVSDEHGASAQRKITEFGNAVQNQVTRLRELIGLHHAGQVKENVLSAACESGIAAIRGHLVVIHQSLEESARSDRADDSQYHTALVHFKHHQNNITGVDATSACIKVIQELERGIEIDADDSQREQLIEEVEQSLQLVS